MLKIDGQKVKKITINGQSGSVWTHNGVERFRAYEDIFESDSDKGTSFTKNNDVICSVNSNEYTRVQIDLKTTSVSSESGSCNLLLCSLSNDPLGSNFPTEYIYDSVVIATTGGYSLAKDVGSVYLNVPPNHGLVNISVQLANTSSSVRGRTLKCTVTRVRAYA